MPRRMSRCRARPVRRRSRVGRQNRVVAAGRCELAEDELRVDRIAASIARATRRRASSRRSRFAIFSRHARVGLGCSSGSSAAASRARRHEVDLHRIAHAELRAVDVDLHAARLRLLSAGTARTGSSCRPSAACRTRSSCRSACVPSRPIVPVTHGRVVGQRRFAEQRLRARRPRRSATAMTSSSAPSAPAPTSIATLRRR